jgi:hypothetical protein
LGRITRWLQAQLKLPGALQQVAFSSQLAAPVVHSSMSEQVTPSPQTEPDARLTRAEQPASLPNAGVLDEGCQ